MISDLAKLEIGKLDFDKLNKKVNINSGFKHLLKYWDSIVVSIDTKELVIGYHENALQYNIKLFLNEEYFESNENFNIVKETDLNLSQKINCYCYDKKGNLAWTKFNHFPDYDIDMGNIVDFDNERGKKILSFLDDIYDEED